MKEKVAKAALIGALTDGGVSVLERSGPEGVIRDMGCGATTGATGATVTMLYQKYLGGRWGMLAGAAASVATRYAYRSVFGPTLTKEDEDERQTMRYKSR